MYGNVRAASITVLSIQAATDCILWKLDRQTFKKIVLSATQPNMHSSFDFITRLPIFGALEPVQQLKIMSNSHYLEYQIGDILIEQGKKMAERYLFLIESGTVQVVREGAVLEEVGAGGYVGEKVILMDETPSASAVVHSVCKIYRVPETVLTTLPSSVLQQLREAAASRAI